MATVYYYNANDLTARRNKTARWIHARSLQLARELKYSGNLDNNSLTNLSFVVALLKTVEEYTPIVSDDDDINNLTEAQADNVFNLISDITGLVFLPKNTVYEEEIADANNQFRQATLTNNTLFTFANSSPVRFNILNKEPLIRN